MFLFNETQYFLLQIKWNQIKICMPFSFLFIRFTLIFFCWFLFTVFTSLCVCALGFLFKLFHFNYHMSVYSVGQCFVKWKTKAEPSSNTVYGWKDDTMHENFKYNAVCDEQKWCIKKFHLNCIAQMGCPLISACFNLFFHLFC